MRALPLNELCLSCVVGGLGGGLVPELSIWPWEAEQQAWAAAKDAFCAFDGFKLADSSGVNRLCLSVALNVRAVIATVC